jgi:hypothetical protein
MCLLTQVLQRMSVKDTSPYNRTWWRNPVNWRDHLPRELAIMQRLESLEHQNSEVID